MILANQFLRKQGADLVFSTSVLNGGLAVTAGQTVTINVLRISDQKWWNIGTDAFDLDFASKPSPISAPQEGTTGNYKYTLLGGHSDSSINYQTHIIAAGVVVYNYSPEQQIGLDESLIGLFPSGIVAANIVQMNGLTTADGMSFNYIMQLIGAAVNGRFKLDTPSDGKITFYKRDNVSVLTVVSVTDIERTRDS